MKSKKKYCLNMASYKYKSGYKHLLPPIIIKESSNLNINILNLVPSQNKCPCGKSCPNYKIIFELKQEIIKLIDKISQLKKITDLSIPKMKEENSKNLNLNINNESNCTPEKDKHDNISNQLINSFRNSSKNKLLKLKNSPYNSNNLFRYNLLGADKIKLRPNSAKNSQLKEALDKVFNKGKEDNNTNEKKEGTNIRFKNLSNTINKKINMNFFSSSCHKRDENPLRNKKINNNHRYETEIRENNSFSRNMQFFTHESFSSLKKEKNNELSSLNLHLSNSIISPAIKITPKNLFESIRCVCDNKENKIFNEKKSNNQ